MEQQGWVKFYREWLDNPIITKDSEHLAVWTYLLLNATHNEKDVIFNGKKIKLRKGQMIISCKEIYDQLKIERNKMDRIIKLFKNEELIEQQTSNHKSLITLARWEFYQGFNEEQNEELIRNQRGTKQETENEKEKRSKREKDKEKEKNKNERMKEYIYPSLSPLGETGREKLSYPSGKALFSSDKENVYIPKTEEELDRWLNEDDGIDEWDKMQLYYRQLHSDQWSVVSDQQLDYDIDTDNMSSLAPANPIQQEKEERSNPQPQTPSPFATGEHLPQATSFEATPQLHCEALHLNKVQHRSEKDLEEFFGLFWQAYPKKVGKGYAQECFKKIKPSRKLLDTMLEAIAKQKKSDMWKRDKGQYIPNPSTWLNQKRWEDDLGGEADDDGQIPWSKMKLPGLYF